MSKKAGVYKYLEVSTCHITEKDNKTLRTIQHEQIPPVIVYPYEYGYWVVTPEKTRSLKVPLSKSFKKIVEKAWEVNAQIIRLDRDAEVHEDLKIHNW